MPSDTLDPMGLNALNGPGEAATMASFRAMLRPHLRRILPMVVGWSISMGLFLRALEYSGIQDPQRHLGLFNNLSASLINAASCEVMFLSWIYVAGGWYWQHSAAARQRYERDGFYALIPPQVSLPVCLMGLVVGSLMGYHLWHLTVPWTLPPGHVTPGFGAAITLSVFSSVILVVIDSLLVRTALERDRSQLAQRQAIEAQLRRLQAQMEPHMLFNTLANLHALIESDPDRAQRMLAHLIDYLRATLGASRNDTLSLGDEMARVQDYLALMQIRMGPRLRVELDVPESLASVNVPPMLIQPLVENAIKHGLDPMPEGGLLRISAHLNDRTLRITVQDTGRGLVPTTHKPQHKPQGGSSSAPPRTLAGALTSGEGGFGLDCIATRLHTCYGADARFTLGPVNGQPGTVATLYLPVGHAALSTQGAKP